MTVLIEALADLAAQAEQIKKERPAATCIAEAEVRLDYLLDAETGEEYAAVDVALFGGWLAEIEGDTCGALTGFRLYLDQE